VKRPQSPNPNPTNSSQDDDEEKEAFKRAWAFFAAELRAEARLYLGEAPSSAGEQVCWVNWLVDWLID
jgi:hypothetical protein